MDDENIGAGAPALTQVSHQSIVELDQHQATYPPHQVTGECSAPGSDFQHLVLGANSQGLHDLPLEVRVHQKVLAQ